MVLSLLDWPGYTTSVGDLADPVDGYLVTVHVPPSAQGETVDVDLPPAGLDRRGRRVGDRAGGRRAVVGLVGGQTVASCTVTSRGAAVQEALR